MFFMHLQAATESASKTGLNKKNLNSKFPCFVEALVIEDQILYVSHYFMEIYKL